MSLYSQGGGFNVVKTVHATGLPLETDNYYDDIVLGNVPNNSALIKFGRNQDVSSTGEDIWNGGGVYTGQPASYTPELVTVVSSSVDDAAAGTGARTVRIEGLKTSTSTVYETEDITLNGTTPVDSVDTWWRVNRAYVLTAGSGGANAGTLTCAAKVTTSNVFMVMPVGVNQTAIAAWTVPYGSQAIIKTIGFAGGRTTGTTIANAGLFTRTQGGVYRRRHTLTAGNGVSAVRQFVTGLLCAAGDDIKMRVTSASANSGDFLGYFEILNLKS